MDNELLYVYDSLGIAYQDFYHKEHVYIYEVIQDLWHSRKTIDVLTVADSLQRKDVLEMIGGVDYLYDVS